MAQRVEHGHPFNDKDPHSRQRKQPIDSPEDLESVEQSGDRSSGGDLVAFGTEDMMSPTHPKRYGQEKGEDPYATQPLCKRPPEENAPGQLIQPRVHSDSRGSEAAHRLEVGVEVVRTNAQHERQRAQRGNEKPAYAAHKHGARHVERSGPEHPARDHPQRKGDDRGYNESDHGSPTISPLAPIDDSDDQRKQNDQAQYAQQAADRMKYGMNSLISVSHGIRP